MITYHHAAIDTFKIYSILAKLGVTADYLGFRQAAHAIYLAAQNPDKLCHISKCLYPEVARRYHTTWNCVERNIRTVAKIAWANNPSLLSTMAGHSLNHKPTASHFIAIVSLYILNVHPAA